MASSKQIETSLLTEHFTYTPLTLIDDIINTVNELVYRAVTAVEEGLSSAPAESLGFAERAAAEGREVVRDSNGRPVFPEARMEIQDGVHQLETLLEATVDKNFDKLELYVLRNILNIPDGLAPYMRLNHYKDLDLSQAETSENATMEDLEKLHAARKKLQETLRLNKALVAEYKANKQLLGELQALLLPLQQQQQAMQTRLQHEGGDGSGSSAAGPQPSLAFLTADPAAQALGINQPVSSSNASTTAEAGIDDSGGETRARSRPLAEHSEFIQSQLPALKQLLATLKPRLEALERNQVGAGAAGTAPVGERERERRAYIEAQARNILEARGAQASSSETGTGVGPGGGRGPGPIDVESGEGLARPARDTGRMVSPEEVRGLEGVADSLKRAGSGQQRRD